MYSSFITSRPDLVKSCVLEEFYYDLFQGVSLYDKGGFESARHIT